MANTKGNGGKSNRTGALNRSVYSELFPPKMSKGDQRKLQILEAAISTYANIEVDYVSFEDIARSAKLSRPLVQHHFPEKLELFKAAVKFVRARMQLLAVEYLNEASTPRTQFEAYVRSTFYWASENPRHMHTWLFFYYQCVHHPELKRFHTEMTSIGRERIVAMLESLEIKGDIEKMAFQIQQIITGGLVELSSDNGRSMPGIAEDSVDLCIRAIGLR